MATDDSFPQRPGRREAAFPWITWVAVLVAGILILRSMGIGWPRGWVQHRNLRQDRPIDAQFVDHDMDLSQVTPRDVAPRGTLRDDEQQTIELFENCSRSVVFIRTSAYAVSRFSLNPMNVQVGTGSGFVWDKEGHIVTNFHVLEGASRADVILSDQTTWPAELVGSEPDKDLAVLKIRAPARRLNPLPIGSSSDLQVGQSVYAIGNPFGLDQTLTTGVISGLEREIRARNDRRIEGVIQTDAAINPGNSGGPLLDSSGRLIGVNTAIVSPTGAYAGVGFAIPVDTVNRVVPQLVEFGQTIRPWFGVALAPPNVLQRAGIEGVLVLRVEPGSTAAEAGIQPTQMDEDNLRLGDIILALDGETIRTAGDLHDYLANHKVGDSAKITVLRDAGTDNTRKVTLQARLKAQAVQE
jgi:S1-C subfamily serine protease